MLDAMALGHRRVSGRDTCPMGGRQGEQRLAGGSVTPVVRVGATARRATGPWSPRVHELLRHLTDAGFDGAPRFLDIDEQGREVLSFIDGEITTYGPPTGMHANAALTAAREGRLASTVRANARRRGTRVAVLPAAHGHDARYRDGGWRQRWSGPRVRQCRCSCRRARPSALGSARNEALISPENFGHSYYGSHVSHGVAPCWKATS